MRTGYQQICLSNLRMVPDIEPQVVAYLNRQIGLVKYARFQIPAKNANAHVYVRFWNERNHRVAWEHFNQPDDEIRFAGQTLRAHYSQAEHDDLYVSWPRTLTLVHAFPSRRFICRTIRNSNGDIAPENIPESPDIIQWRWRNVESPNTIPEIIVPATKKGLRTVVDPNYEPDGFVGDIRLEQMTPEQRSRFGVRHILSNKPEQAQADTTESATSNSDSSPVLVEDRSRLRSKSVGPARTNTRGRKLTVGERFEQDLAPGLRPTSCQR